MVVPCWRVTEASLAHGRDHTKAPGTMQHDELIWQVINHTHCSYKSQYVPHVARRCACAVHAGWWHSRARSVTLLLATAGVCLSAERANRAVHRVGVGSRGWGRARASE